MVTNKISKIFGILSPWTKLVFPLNALLSIYHSIFFALELRTAFMGYTCKSSLGMTESKTVKQSLILD